MGIFNLHGRVAVVTGGTAGLGRGMAIALARQGADLAILARRPDKLTETAREIESLGGAVPPGCVRYLGRGLGSECGRNCGKPLQKSGHFGEQCW